MKFHLFQWPNNSYHYFEINVMVLHTSQVREVRVWSGVLTESDVRRNMYLQRIDLVQRALTKRNKCTLIGYWPMNRLVSGTWPWQGSLVTCTSHLETHREKTLQLRIIFSTLPWSQFALGIDELMAQEKMQKGDAPLSRHCNFWGISRDMCFSTSYMFARAEHKKKKLE